MNHKRLLAFTLLLILGKVSDAQSITGVWKGTSLCQIKNSPCHDENVVYHITKETSEYSYQIIANKIIDGKEVDMGTLNYSYDSKLKTLISIDTARKVRWEFKLTDNEMHGTLVVNGNLYRIVDLKKK